MSPCPRRTFLAAALRAGAGLGLVGLVPAAGCRGDRPAGPPLLRLSLSGLAEGETARHELAGRPVAVTREGATVVARSLLCTHQGCEVVWHRDAGEYVCPCHEGRFDAAGRPVYGPPRLPLRELPVTVTGDEVVIEA